MLWGLKYLKNLFLDHRNSEPFEHKKGQHVLVYYIHFILCFINSISVKFCQSFSKDPQLFTIFYVACWKIFFLQHTKFIILFLCIFLCINSGIYVILISILFTCNSSAFGMSSSYPELFAPYKQFSNTNGIFSFFFSVSRFYSISILPPFSE